MSPGLPSALRGHVPVLGRPAQGPPKNGAVFFGVGARPFVVSTKGPPKKKHI